MARTYSLPTMRPARVGRGSLARRADRGPHRIVDGPGDRRQARAADAGVVDEPPRHEDWTEAWAVIPREEDGAKSIVGWRAGSHS